MADDSRRGIGRGGVTDSGHGLGGIYHAARVQLAAIETTHDPILLWSLRGARRDPEGHTFGLTAGLTEDTWCRIGSCTYCLTSNDHVVYMWAACLIVVICIYCVPA